MTEREEYILGTGDSEIDRLRFQHEVWSAPAFRIWQEAGLRAGDRVLDLGCGPGFTSLGLADVVGPGGKVIASDQSAHFLSYLQSECDRLGASNIVPCPGPVESLDLEDGSLDGAYARWLFCWLPDPAAVLGRVAWALRPGGVVALQEYIDWAAMAMLPPCPSFDRGIDACMRSWEEGDGTIDVGAQIPSMAKDLGLRVESVRPVARVGRVGSLEWRWIEQFLWSYLPKLVESGLFRDDEWSAFRESWEERRRDPESRLQTPTMADIILRKN